MTKVLEIGDCLEPIKQGDCPVEIGRVTKTKAFTIGIFNYKFQRVLDYIDGEYIATAIFFDKYINNKYKLIT